MKKDAYYFPHYCNARHDRKIKRLIKELGIEGYGIYFMLLEVLREQQDFRYPLSDCDLLADEFKTSEAKLKTVICNYELFQIDENNSFFSMKFIYYLQPYLEKTIRARDAANLRWNKTKNLEIESINDANADANALQMESKSNATVMQGKERKGKESKGKESKLKDDMFDLSFVDNDFIEIVKDWLQYKKERKQSYKSISSIKVMHQELLKLSNNDIQLARIIINKAIGNNWSGFHKLNDQDLKLIENKPTLFSNKLTEEQKRKEEEFFNI